MIIEVKSEVETRLVGEKLGKSFMGGEVVELVGDVGAGKTSFTKGIALGLAVDETIQSPTFTISRQYEGRDDIRLAHYDFYRINDAGIMAEELREVLEDPKTVTVVEWSKIVEDVLPKKRIRIEITSPTSNTRVLKVDGADMVELA